MKHKVFFRNLMFFLFTPLLLTGCSSEPVVGPQGEPGEPGQDGVSITSVLLTSSEGNVDTYTIYYSNETISNFTVTNGIDGQSIKGDKGNDGHTPIITVGENGNWFVDNVDSGTQAQGRKGDKGDDGCSILTGNGSPIVDSGYDGDSYIDLQTYDYYVKSDDEWVKKGNIKGEKGDSGISITSTQIDDNGDLIVTLSNDEIINAGHVKDVDEYTVKFYCDDLFVDAQLVKYGEKIALPELDDFVVKHWYIDKEFEYEWFWYGCVVTEDMSLYGDYTPISKSVSYSKDNEIFVDDYGFGEATLGSKEICVSKAIETTNYLTTLENQGILFNKEEIGYIEQVKVDISDDGFSSARIYYGNSPLSLDNYSDLSSGDNTINLSNYEYFTIQNLGDESLNVDSLEINYKTKTKFYDDELPTVVINTDGGQAVTSRTNYLDCKVSTIGGEKDVSELKAQIKVRGNSTANSPKKPYRIKLNKKNSLFGYEKAKNWVLLADYMDATNMHNYSALKFAKMVRGEDSFGVDPLHVNVVLNGENVGIYEFGEHIDAKEGRLDIEQDNIWEKDFDDINFYIERDLSTTQDSLETEGVTYFRVPMENYELDEYVFALKYPEKEDFEEELEGGQIDTHEEEFQAFFDSLQAYVTGICEKFVAYYNDASAFTSLSESVDVVSLAEYAVTDQAFRESDHKRKSFKMYRVDGGLLKFGPNWDYDACVLGLPFQGTYVLDPFNEGWNHYQSLYFGDIWGYTLFNDVANGRPLFKAIWDRISDESITNFISALHDEMNKISSYTVKDCEKWMHNEYYSVFSNLQYYWKWIETQLRYLKQYYA